MAILVTGGAGFIGSHTVIQERRFLFTKWTFSTEKA